MRLREESLVEVVAAGRPVGDCCTGRPGRCWKECAGGRGTSLAETLIGPRLLSLGPHGRREVLLQSRAAALRWGREGAVTTRRGSRGLEMLGRAWRPWGSRDGRPAGLLRNRCHQKQSRTVANRPSGLGNLGLRQQLTSTSGLLCRNQSWLPPPPRPPPG